MSLTHPYEDENVFARIIRGELPCAKIFEDEQSLAFMDAFPQTAGHCLIIGKQIKAVNLLDAPADTLGHLMGVTQKVAGAVVKAFSPDGFRIVQFNGSPAGQSVFHLHFHVIPVYTNSPEGAHGQGQADPETLTAQAEKIRAAL